jgi:predicted  nucleic acid-binding Zn-ribbon protein
MEEILDLLVEIQRLDDEIKQTESKIENIPKQIAILEREIDSLKNALQEKNNRRHNIKKNYVMKESDLADNESKITKLNNQTFAVKTNEEYRAILNEIEFLKKENKRIEDEMMNLLEEEESLKSTIGKLETETNELTEERTNEINELKKNQEELAQKLEDLEANFDNNFNKLPNDVKEQYTKIKKVRGNAVCLIIDETCTGCFTNLTPQFMNELKQRNEILLCVNCGRILIYAVPNK